MTAPTTTTGRLEILVLASDTDDRQELAGRAVKAVMDYTAAEIFTPVQLRILQSGTEIYAHTGTLASAFYEVTEWGYGTTLADWGRTEVPQPEP